MATNTDWPIGCQSRGGAHHVLIDSVTSQIFASLSSPKTLVSNTSNSSAFEDQLSSALAESLQKLGVGAGEVNITIKNPTPTTRQILVTYSVGASDSAAPVTAPPNGTGTTEPRNPFSGYMDSPTYTAAPKPDPMPWAPYSGPRDVRDGLPEGGGATTASGAPLIRNNEKSTPNQYGYTGPATNNPYFTTPSNPLRDGYVQGFHNWFADAMILGGLSGPIPANKMNYSTEEGAQEALRIVKQFVPDATVVKSNWHSGPFAVDKPIYEIELSDGRKLNAGGVLCGYYNQGSGVAISSDETIRRSIQLA
jgi:hypothetical protein